MQTNCPPVLAVLLAACASAPTHAPDRRQEEPPYELRFDEVDREVAQALAPVLDRGVADVEAFFGAGFAAPFRVTICRDRPTFDASFPPEWGVTQTQGWMVATGVATDLRILSPRVWKTQASGHDPDDAVHLRGILTHELVHVFHGQRNPTGDFTGCESIGWFLEGLAVFASGQLETGHRARAAEAVANGKVPRRLATAWTGEYRYGVCGSLVEHLDARCGRAATMRMLAATTQDELLEVVGIGEDQLLASWARAQARNKR